MVKVTMIRNDGWVKEFTDKDVDKESNGEFVTDTVERMVGFLGEEDLANVVKIVITYIP